MSELVTKLRTSISTPSRLKKCGRSHPASLARLKQSLLCHPGHETPSAEKRRSDFCSPRRLCRSAAFGIEGQYFEAGACVESADLSPRTLPAKASVRSFLLHFSPETQRVERRAKRVAGSITFDQPVVGIIVGHEELRVSSLRFGRRRDGGSKHRRALNLTGGKAGDRITLSEDRKTVTLDLISPRRSSDLVRVIVDGASDILSSARRKRI